MASAPVDDWDAILETAFAPGMPLSKLEGLACATPASRASSGPRTPEMPGDSGDPKPGAENRGRAKGSAQQLAARAEHNRRYRAAVKRRAADAESRVAALSAAVAALGVESSVHRTLTALLPAIEDPLRFRADTTGGGNVAAGPETAAAGFRAAATAAVAAFCATILSAAPRVAAFSAAAAAAAPGSQSPEFAAEAAALHELHARVGSALFRLAIVCPCPCPVLSTCLTDPDDDGPGGGRGFGAPWRGVTETLAGLNPPLAEDVLCRAEALYNNQLRWLAVIHAERAAAAAATSPRLRRAAARAVSGLTTPPLSWASAWEGAELRRAAEMLGDSLEEETEETYALSLALQLSVLGHAHLPAIYHGGYQRPGDARVPNSWSILGSLVEAAPAIRAAAGRESETHWSH